jgi:protocatechuate 3,4-dioxygenase beta subunit
MKFSVIGFIRLFERRALICLGAFIAVAACRGQGFEGTIPPPRVVTGTVHDASGAGASGVLLALYPGPGPGGPKYAEAETDKDGGFKMTVEFNRSQPFISFPPDTTCFLMARDIGRNLAVMKRIVNLPAHMDLTLQPGFRLSTVIEDVKGAPLRGIPVDLVWEPDYRHHKLKPEVTDGAGRATFAGLPRGSAYFIVNEDCPPGYGTVSASLTPAETGTDSLELSALTLKLANRTVAGKVLGEDAKPLAGAKVYLTGTGQPRGAGDELEAIKQLEFEGYKEHPGWGPEVQADEGGNFLFEHVCDGPVQLYSEGHGIRGAAYALIRGAAYTVGGDTHAEINPLDRIMRVPPVITSGRVLDPNGAPAAGVRVSCMPIISEFPNGSDGIITTGSDGKYSVPWVSNWTDGGQCWIYAQDFKNQLAVIRKVDNSITNLDLHLQKALTLAAKAVDEKGKPIMTARVGVVTIMLPRTQPGASGQQQWEIHADFGDGKGPRNSNGTPAIAGKDGVVEVKDLPQGEDYSITIWTPGYSRATGYGVTKLEAGPKETGTDRLEFPPVVWSTPQNLPSDGTH